MPINRKEDLFKLEPIVNDKKRQNLFTEIEKWLKEEALIENQAENGPEEAKLPDEDSEEHKEVAEP